MTKESQADDACFTWQDLGDINAGRPNLGLTVPVGMYRLLLFTLREAAAKAHGAGEARRLLIEAGRTAGREFCRNALDVTLEASPFLAAFQQKLKEWSIGLLRVEEADFENHRYVMSVAEDLDCSGLEVSDETVCDFDEGFIAGVFREYTGQEFEAREIDCWASGDRVCRFRVWRS
jgi:predicted hydrocarbon binding protein